MLFMRKDISVMVLLCVRSVYLLIPKDNDVKYHSIRTGNFIDLNYIWMSLFNRMTMEQIIQGSSF